MVSLAPKPPVACDTDPAARWATDRDLLAQFVGGEQDAFTELVQRHAELVMRVCHRLLRQADDVEDAFQATFFVLARKAGSLRWQDSVAGWLHQTARRTALRLRAVRARRQAVESDFAKLGQESSGANPGPAAQAALRELAETLDAELANLPARFREVILLSQVEGLGRDEIARRLGITPAAVKDRLERGRTQLRSRLLGRGITLTGAAMASWLAPAAAPGAGSAMLAGSTSTAATAFASGALAGGMVPSAAYLAQGVLHMMGIEKMKVVFTFILSLLAAGGIALGVLLDQPDRFEKGLRGEIVDVSTSGAKPTVTIKLDELEVMLNLDVDPAARIWSAYESTSLKELKKGQYVSLRLGSDHRTVEEIHIRGEQRQFVIQGVAGAGKLSVSVADDDDDDDDKQPAAQRAAREVVLGQGAIIRIGGLPATTDDLKVGMRALLEFAADGRTVNAIEADAPEGSIVEGRLTGVDVARAQVTVLYDDGNDAEVERTLTVHAAALIVVDGKPATLGALKHGSDIRLRISADQKSIRALRVTSPEAEVDPSDDEPTQPGA